MHETLAVIVFVALCTLSAIGGVVAGGAMIRWPRSPLDPDLPPARAGGLPALPGQSALARAVMTLLGIATELVGLMFGFLAVLAAIFGLVGLPVAGKLILAAALAGGALIASRLHARTIRQPA